MSLSRTTSQGRYQDDPNHHDHTHIPRDIRRMEKTSLVRSALTRAQALIITKLTDHFPSPAAAMPTSNEQRATSNEDKRISHGAWTIDIPSFSHDLQFQQADTD
jgi:hypothetical protein